MSYVNQIEQYVGYYPDTVAVNVPETCGVTTLPAYPHVVVHSRDQDYCELSAEDGMILARFRLVG